MDYDSHNFDLDPEPVRATQTKISKITLAAMGALATVLALIGLDVALVSGAQATPSRPIMKVEVVKMSGKPVVLPVVYLTVSPTIRPGPDGKLHDAFSVTSFEVHVGHAVKLVINNTDSSPHSITAPDAGVNILVQPGTHTYTLLVRKTGRFEWYCTQPCDPYSMSHAGYMRGYITSI
jgi:nitrous oxide reductase